MLLAILKFLHVLAAIVAVGANATYGAWLARGDRQPESLPFSLRGVKLLDDRLANPAYAVLLLTGLPMALMYHLPLTTPWLLTALALYVALTVLGLFGYTPTLRKQIRALESEGRASPRYQALARRGTGLGVVLAVLALTIVFLMVVRPTLWA